MDGIGDAVGRAIVDMLIVCALGGLVLGGIGTCAGQWLCANVEVSIGLAEGEESP